MMTLVYQLGSWLKGLQGDSDATVCLFLPNCQQSLIILFGTYISLGIRSLANSTAATLFNIPVSIPPIDKNSLQNIHRHIEAANPFVLVLAEDGLLEDMNHVELPNLKHIITIQDRFGGTYPLHIQLSVWKTLIAMFPSEEGEFPAIDESATCFPIRVTYEINDKVKVSRFTHQNLAAAVASHIKVLPSSHQWTEKDRVLIFTSELSMFTVVSLLTAFVSKSSLVFLSKMTMVPQQLLKASKPSIIVTDDETTFSLLEQIQDLSLLPTIKQQLNEAKLSRGTLPSHAVLSVFSPVRLIYSSTSILDNSKPVERIEDSERTHLNSADTNAIRALTGARFIHALTSPLVAGPIASTNVYDYRLNSSHDQQYLTNYGPIAACLEAMLKDEPKNSGSVDENRGRLFVRGCSLPTDDWIDTGIIGAITSDGCIKVRN